MTRKIIISPEKYKEILLLANRIIVAFSSLYTELPNYSIVGSDRTINDIRDTVIDQVADLHNRKYSIGPVLWSICTVDSCCVLTFRFASYNLSTNNYEIFVK